MVATTQKSGSNARVEAKPAPVAEITKILARHYPGLSKATLAATGKVMAVASAAAARLSAEQQRQIMAREDELIAAMETVVAGLVTESTDKKLIALDVNKPVEISKGEGLGKPTNIEEGRRGFVARVKFGTS